MSQDTQLKKNAVTGIGIITGLQIFAKILMALSTIVLARLLSPADFGIVGVANFFFAFIILFQNFGMDSALIYKKENVERALYTGFTLRFGISLVIVVITIAVSPIVASFFNVPEASDVLKVMSILFIIESLIFIPRVVLRKELKFKKFAIPNVVKSFIYPPIVIALAYAGFSYWSLVYAGLIRAFVDFFIWKRLYPWKIRFIFDRKEAKAILGYGKHIFISSIFVFFLLSLDNATAAKFYGAEGLGYYAISFNFANYFIPLVGASIGTVMFPFLTKFWGDREKFSRSYLMMIKYVALFAIPYGFGLFILAPEFVNLILGTKWQPAIWPMRILALSGIFRMISASVGNVYTASGNPKMSPWVTGSQLLLIVLFIFPMAYYYEITGIALTITLCNLYALIVAVILANRIAEVKNLEFLKMLFPIILSGTVMILSIYGMKLFIPMNLATFGLATLLGLGVYFVSLIVLSKGKIIGELRSILAIARSKDSAPGS